MTWHGEGDPEVVGGEISTHNGHRGWIMVAGDEPPFEYVYRCDVCSFEGPGRITEWAAKDDGEDHESVVMERCAVCGRVHGADSRHYRVDTMRGEHLTGPIGSESLKSLARTTEVDLESEEKTETVLTTGQVKNYFVRGAMIGPDPYRISGKTAAEAEHEFWLWFHAHNRMVAELERRKIWKAIETAFNGVTGRG